MRMVHIGFGKTGTTTLQQKVFPYICKKLNIPYIEFKRYFNISAKKESVKCSPLERYEYKPLPEKFIMSSEDLIGEKWQMYEMEKAFETNKIFFDKSCQILITIRKPSDIFNSIYIQNIHNFNFIKEKDFFINKNPKELTNEDKKKYNLYNFSYKTIIDLYKSYYSKVIVVKYENIRKFEFLKDMLPKNSELKSDLVNKFFYESYNKSFSKFGVKLFFFLNNFFSLEKLQIWVENRLVTNPKKIYEKIKNKVLAQLIVRRKIHNIDNLNLLYSKYRINLKNLPTNIAELDQKYEQEEY